MTAQRIHRWPANSPYPFHTAPRARGPVRHDTSMSSSPSRRLRVIVPALPNRQRDPRTGRPRPSRRGARSSSHTAWRPTSAPRPAAPTWPTGYTQPPSRSSPRSPSSACRKPSRPFRELSQPARAARDRAGRRTRREDTKCGGRLNRVPEPKTVPLQRHGSAAGRCGCSPPASTFTAESGAAALATLTSSDRSDERRGQRICVSVAFAGDFRGFPTLAQSGRRGSNPRPSAWEADALPTELRPRCGRF